MMKLLHGGRVLCVVALEENIKLAQQFAYVIEKSTLTKQIRHDIDTRESIIRKIFRIKAMHYQI